MISVTVSPGHNELKIFNETDLCEAGPYDVYSETLTNQLHEPRIFYPSGHWPETVANTHVSAHFR